MNRFAGLLVAMLVAVSAFAGAARAETVGDADRATIKAIVGGQIQAFQSDDGATAFGFASPTIQHYFPTADAFMSMVKNGYQPVYRPRSVTFGELIDSDIGPIQKVYVTGPDGKNYIAVYTMQRQSDGTWKINGCSLIEDNSPSI